LYSGDFLQGLPLAIELAAARIKVLSPQAMLTRLQSRLELVSGKDRDVPTRQQTLRNTMGAPVPPNEHARYKREMELVRTQLGEEGCERAYAEGRSMTTEQAVDYAFEEAAIRSGIRDQGLPTSPDP
jgi:hypothetical protein